MQAAKAINMIYYRAFGGHVHWETFFISAILGKVLV